MLNEEYDEFSLKRMSVDGPTRDGDSSAEDHGATTVRDLEMTLLSSRSEVVSECFLFSFGKEHQ